MPLIDPYEFIPTTSLIVGFPGTGKTMAAVGVAESLAEDVDCDVALVTNMESLRWDKGPVLRVAPRLRKDLTLATVDSVARQSAGCIVLLDEIQAEFSTLSLRDQVMQSLYALQTEARKFFLTMLLTAPEGHRVSGVLRGLVTHVGTPYLDREYSVVKLRAVHELHTSLTMVFRRQVLAGRFDTFEWQESR